MVLEATKGFIKLLNILTVRKQRTVLLIPNTVLKKGRIAVPPVMTLVVFCI